MSLLTENLPIPCSRPTQIYILEIQDIKHFISGTICGWSGNHSCHRALEHLENSTVSDSAFAFLETVVTMNNY